MVGLWGRWFDGTAPLEILASKAEYDTRMREKFQVLDTGGLGVKDHGKGVGALPSAATSQAGNWDSPPTKQVTGGDPHRGVGVWLRTTAADGDALYEHVRKVLIRLGRDVDARPRDEEPGEAERACAAYEELQESGLVFST